MAKVLNGVETLPKISAGCVGYTNVTGDRQTTEGLFAYSKHEREFTFAKNGMKYQDQTWYTYTL